MWRRGPVVIRRPGPDTLDGSGNGQNLGISLRSVQRIWYAHQLHPHRVRSVKRSRDLRFAAKLADIVGLYFDPPTQAVVLSIVHPTACRWNTG